jgi:hypothetical protein
MTAARYFSITSFNEPVGLFGPKPAVFRVSIQTYVKLPNSYVTYREAEYAIFL